MRGERDSPAPETASNFARQLFTAKIGPPYGGAVPAERSKKVFQFRLTQEVIKISDRIVTDGGDRNARSQVGINAAGYALNAAIFGRATRACDVEKDFHLDVAMDYARDSTKHHPIFVSNVDWS